MKGYQVARLLAYVMGLVNQELLLQVEYLVAENSILRAQALVQLRLSNEERSIRYSLRARRSEPSPNRMNLERHSSFTERTQRSANAFRFGLLAGSGIVFTPPLASAD